MFDRLSLNRRTFLTSASTAALAAALPRHAAAAEEMTTALAWIANAQNAGYWIAIDKGYFAAEGLEPKTLMGGPNAPQALVVLSAGKATVGQTNWLPFLDAVAQGNDFVILGANFPISAAGLISLPKKPITKAADLVNAKILAQGPAEKTTIEATLKLNNLPPTFTFVPAGFSPEPLLSGAGDAYFCFVTNQPIILEKMGMKQGKDFIVTRFADLGYQVPTTLFFVRRDTLQKQRKELIGYMRAMVKGWTENEKDPTLGAKLSVDKYGKDLGLDLKQQIRQNELQIPLTRLAPGDKMFWLDPKLVSGPMYAAARASGRDKLPDPAKIIDMSVLEEAYKGI